MSGPRLTWEEFQRTRERAHRASDTYLATVCPRIQAAGDAVGPWPLCREAMERATRREAARLWAALDQHDAAIRDVPGSWLTPHERRMLA